jgi:hypothetical protein
MQVPFCIPIGQRTPAHRQAGFAKSLVPGEVEQAIVHAGMRRKRESGPRARRVRDRQQQRFELSPRCIIESNTYSRWRLRQQIRQCSCRRTPAVLFEVLTKWHKRCPKTDSGKFEKDVRATPAVCFHFADIDRPRRTGCDQGDRCLEFGGNPQRRGDVVVGPQGNDAQRRP